MTKEAGPGWIRQQRRRVRFLCAAAHGAAEGVMVMGTTEDKIVDVSDRLRSAVADFNRAASEAASLGLRVDIDTRTVESVAQPPASMLIVEIFERR